MTLQEIVSLLIFGATIGIVISEKIHRMIASIAGGVLMVAAGTIMKFYSFDQALKAVDFNTIGLLLGMMILIALLQETGFFEYMAVKAAKISKGNPWKILVILCTITTFFSMFLDNVTTIILIAPVTIVISRIIGISPIPLLISEAILSNIGGVATLIGDPPNIIIGSRANLNFMDFITHLLPLVLFVWFFTLLLIKFLFRNQLKDQTGQEDSLELMTPEESLKDKKTARNIVLTLLFTIFLFFIHHIIHFTPSLVAFTGASIALLIVKPDINKLMKEIEWSVLVFFIFLFIGVGGLEASGVLDRVGELFTGIASNNMLAASLLLIWGGAIISAFIDNIPFTMAMLPVILHLQAKGINVTPLWWALAIGVGFGGNGTPVGATANVVVLSLSEKNDTPITFKNWMKTGMPVMIFNCLIASIFFAICYTCFNYYK